MWLGPAFYDPDTRELRSEAGGVTRLTPTAARTLLTLARAPGMVLRERLGHAVGDPKNLDVLIWRLRRVVAPHGVRVVTRWGEGWELVRGDAPERCPVCGASTRRDP